MMPLSHSTGFSKIHPSTKESLYLSYTFLFADAVLFCAYHMVANPTVVTYDSLRSLSFTEMFLDNIDCAIAGYIICDTLLVFNCIL